ncbi:hypothetical protein L2E82_14831 [Cichorium intybus]|uniref:Uncharacterized protein n=1 Tax=Cichorium intybus TaxID=13427 RepID=A0ACB9F0J0_CICIN|nr:hypothetical protein L2E82_14831 [Cichorium intybus]
MMIDVVGKIIQGRRVRRDHSFQITLIDHTGYAIQLKLYDAPGTMDVVRTYRAIRATSIIFVSRVKLFHRHPQNLLRSTQYSEIAVEPNMYEAGTIRLIWHR